jgi:hypothetical protein
MSASSAWLPVKSMLEVIPSLYERADSNKRESSLVPAGLFRILQAGSSSHSNQL